MYNKDISLKKGALEGSQSGILAAVVSALVLWAEREYGMELSAETIMALIGGLTGGIHSVIRFIRNWVKHRNDA